MLFYMTNSTKCNNIKPVLFGVAFVMVVMNSLVSATTQSGVCRKEFAGSYSGLNGHTRLFSYWISIFRVISLLARFIFVAFAKIAKIFFSRIFAFRAFCGCLSFYGAPIPLHGSFSRLTFAVNSCATFTAIRFAKWISFTCTEFGNIFDFFARVTLSCYNLFRHGFFLIKKLCLEPLQTQYLCGSFYYNRDMYNVKGEM